MAKPGCALYGDSLLTVAAIVYLGDPLHIEDGEGLFERLERVAERRVLVRDISAIAEVGYSTRDAAIVHLLRVVHLVPARIAGRVEVSDPLDIVTNRADDIALHD